MSYSRNNQTYILRFDSDGCYSPIPIEILPDKLEEAESPEAVIEEYIAKVINILTSKDGIERNS